MPFQEQTDEKIRGSLLPVLLLVMSIGSAGPANAAMLEQKLHLVERLHQRLQLDPKNDPYRASLAEARALIEQGQSEQAKARLDEMIRQLARTYRTRGSGDQAERQRTKYQRRRVEVRSLLSSLEQWIAQQGAAQVQLDVARLHATLATADKAAGTDGIARAIALMDVTYQELVTELTRLRDKETVNYRLEFKGPEDEYRYEVRRYQTYRLLLRMKLDGQVFGDARMGRVQALRRQALELNSEAEKQARSGEFNAAIATQSGATETLIKALAVVGVYLSK
ncbi:hypothetical protein [Sedimenticola hydrogenitrophicus]|uniref:hypothetical protein n=1 Tax=Sedimenticola hydrogenitrophicus TaxID=2967975 RepID=UPI0023B0CFE1|nr:hypothetical protein [Sedimenticola hydrogenitrophicus]